MQYITEPARHEAQTHFEQFTIISSTTAIIPEGIRKKQKRNNRKPVNKRFAPLLHQFLGQVIRADGACAGVRRSSLQTHDYPPG